MMRKLLITGFDPFGGASVNPAWQAVSLLPDIIGDFLSISFRSPRSSARQPTWSWKLQIFSVPT